VFFVSPLNDWQSATPRSAVLFATFHWRAFVCVWMYMLVSQVVGCSGRNSSVTPRATKNFLVFLVSKSGSFFSVILFSSKVNLHGGSSDRWSTTPVEVLTISTFSPTVTPVSKKPVLSHSNTKDVWRNSSLPPSATDASNVKCFVCLDNSQHTQIVAQSLSWSLTEELGIQIHIHHKNVESAVPYPCLCMAPSRWTVTSTASAPKKSWANWRSYL